MHIVYFVHYGTYYCQKEEKSNHMIVQLDPPLDLHVWHKHIRMTSRQR